MFDLHRELNVFYEAHVRLGAERSVLAEHRDTNLSRLKAGLVALGYPSSFNSRDQGSYAMFTINQHPNKDYDIDIAIIFDAGDLPDTAYNARKRIEAAMIAGGGNFSRDPEAKTNAVRVYYAEGHHVDLAIYRRINDSGLEIVQHAGSDWSNRDPAAITQWFKDAVNQQSPSRDGGATVHDGQMRRVVRWIKKFAKSRSTWSLPGGLIISVLVANHYCPHPNRDDVALYDTMRTIHNWLQVGNAVWNPVDGNLLTARQVDLTRLEQLREKLGVALSHLDTLQTADCTRSQAIGAWYEVFLHPFWKEDDRAELGKSLRAATEAGGVFVGSQGRISVDKPAGRAIKSPPQRFYGEE